MSQLEPQPPSLGHDDRTGARRISVPSTIDTSQALACATVTGADDYCMIAATDVIADDV